MTFPEHLPTALAKIQAGVAVRDARNFAREFLSNAVESPMLDADLILAHSCGLSRLQILTSSSLLLTELACLQAVDFLRRRFQGEPIAYILGHKEFFGLSFEVSRDVLIPRPDTELLVEEALKFIGSRSSVVIDACTGSGCIAIAIAHHAKSSKVIATDLSEKALNVARSNAEKLGVMSQIEFRQGDLLKPCFEQREVDLIVSNPPYIPPADMATLMKDVRDFEPHLALVGQDEDGLGLHHKILQQSLEIMKVGGVLMMEIADGQAEILSKVSFPGFSNAEFLKDCAGILRVVKYNRLPS